MHCMMRFSLFLCVLVCGCQTTTTTTSRVPSSSPLHWTPALTPDEAGDLTPDAAKAILVARAAIEERSKKLGQPAPPILSFQTAHEGDGWTVRVNWVATWENDQPKSMEGYFTVVHIDSKWKVTSMGGQ